MAMRQTPAFGALLKRYRQAAGLTQEALASQAGLSVRAVSDLERGLKVRPHKDTVALLAAALQLSPREHAAFVAARQGSVLPAAEAELPPFVGRSRELVLLERHLAGEGPPLLLLAGEPGIGKSRLLHEAGQRAGAHGLCVLAGECQHRGDETPYAPLLPALARHIDAQPPAQLRADLRGCAWLVRLLPELAGGAIEPLPAWTVPPEQERRLLFAAVARYLRNVAGPAGTLLLLDDVQWAGPDALALLASLLHTDAPLRVLSAYRDTEVQAQDALAVALGDLAHAGLAGQHTLGPLAPADATRLLEALLPEEGEGEGAQQERVLQRAGGVPFVLVSYAQALRAHLLEEGPTDVAVPWDVAQGVRQRVAALPPLAQELLDVATVLGRQAPRRVLQGVVAQPEEVLVVTLEGACQARLLEEEPEGYRFAHDVIREVVEGQLSEGRRLLLHRRVAETLEAAEGEPPVEALAYHYSRSEALEKAVLYLEQAGDRAAAQHAHAAAEGYYRDVVKRLDGLGRTLEAAAAREKLGHVLRTVARYDEALGVLEQAGAAYRAAADREGAHHTLAQIGQVHAARGTPEDGVRRLRAALETVGTDEPSHGLAVLYAALAHLYFAGGWIDEQLAAAERAAELARGVGDNRILVDAQNRRGLALFLMGRLEEAQCVLEEAIPLAEAVGDLVTLGRVFTNVGSVYSARGELEQGRQYAERALEVAERCGDAAQIVFAIVVFAGDHFYTGDWVQARTHLERAVALGRQIGAPRVVAPPLVLLGWLFLAEGTWDDASRYLEEGIIAAERSANEGLRGHAHALLAEREILEGHPDAACGRLAPLLNAPRQDIWGGQNLQPTLAWAYLELGEVAAAAEMVGQAITCIRAVGYYRTVLVHALWVQAMVATRQGRWEEAERTLEEGLALARSMPYPYAEARLLHVYGQMHTQTGEPVPARERLQEALAIFRQLGARKDAERAEKTLTALPQ